MTDNIIVLYISQYINDDLKEKGIKFSFNEINDSFYHGINLQYKYNFIRRSYIYYVISIYFKSLYKYEFPYHLFKIIIKYYYPTIYIQKNTSFFETNFYFDKELKYFKNKNIKYYELPLLKILKNDQNIII